MEFAEFVRLRIKDIKAEILALPDTYQGERSRDSLEIDIAFYETGLEVYQEYVQERCAGLID